MTDNVELSWQEYQDLKKAREDLYSLLKQSGGPEGGSTPIREALRRVPSLAGHEGVEAVVPDAVEHVERPPMPEPRRSVVQEAIEELETLGQAQAFEGVSVASGWPLPSADPPVARQQYADAVQMVEERNKAIADMVARWKTLEVLPGAEGALLMVLSLVLQVASSELQDWDPDCVTCEPKISRGTAAAIRDLYQASMAELVALTDLFEQATSSYAHSRSVFSEPTPYQVHLSNLRSVGLIKLADFLSTNAG